MTGEKALHKKVAVFVRHHRGKYAFGPLTGTDHRAWKAFVYLVELYACGDLNARERAIQAMRSVVASAQQLAGVLEVFVQTIPAVMDWGDDEKLWPKLINGSLAYLRANDRPYDFQCTVCRKAGFGKHKCRGVES